MLQKIFKAGNSMVVSIPHKMLDELELGNGSEVTVELDAALRQIIIRPGQHVIPGVDDEFADQVSAFIEEYRPALEALSHRQAN